MGAERRRAAATPALWRVVALLAVAGPAGCATPQDTETAIEIQAVVGGEAKLPCDIQPPDPSDEVHLVIWFKEGLRSSIYSFDARGRQLDRAEQTMDVSLLEGRAFFRHRDAPAALAIEQVRDADAGTYRCRVDFGKSPTRNSRVKLSVIVPPERLLVMDDQGTYVIGNTPSPYNEGATAKLKCIALGGRPLPRVTWLLDGDPVDDSCDALPSGRVENCLTLGPLDRRFLGATLTCRASNSDQLAPLVRTIVLDMNLKPAQARLLGEPRPLSAGRQHKVQCEAAGSRPAPAISWLLGSAPLASFRVFTNPNSNISVSTLFFTPTPDDNGKVLTCRADNPLIFNSSVEDKRKLEVHYVPVTKLKLGGNDSQAGVQEGSDVRFHCNIKSNPWVNKVIWRHNGKRLYNNSTMGTAVANQSLVLHSVTWERTGAYVCVAENSEGYGESNAIFLEVKYAPVCRWDEPRVVGLSRHQEARAECEVTAAPRDLSFSWTCNDTGQPLEAASSDGSRSLLSLPAGSAWCRHTLLCTAHNAVGVQRRPCVFRLLPAVAPEAPRNCTVVRRTPESLEVSCSEGSSGGVPQRFAMDVLARGSGSPVVASVTSDTPTLAAGGVDAALDLNVSLYAFNSEGRSEAVTMLVPAILRSDGMLATASIANFIAPVFGSLFGVIIVLGSVMAAAVVLQHQDRSCDREVNCGGKPSCTTIFGTTEDQFCSIPLREEDSTHTHHEPDVIPVKCGVYNPFFNKSN
ncbi:hemicentin-2-like [Bacillus rossius redtenbacheri]|uniref:hemicentin-2-like n=1 Tax=Bacillus rossius redtenbacheri TaxID=93214 RepID=UPI002FDCAABA